MQDRYVGDIGDFGKYGMLRYIFDRIDLKLGVNWYLVLDEKDNAHGMKISYLLGNTDFEECDPTLYNKLYDIVLPVKIGKKCINKGARKVSKIETGDILPSHTVFYSTRLVPKERDAWFDNGLDCLGSCDVVFFDPDNGLEVKSYKKLQERGKKYVFYDELKKYYNKQRSLIIYQHRDMKKNKEYLKKFQKIIWFTKPDDIFHLRYHRGTARDYVFVLTKEHSQKIRPILKKMKESLWFKERARFKHPHFTFHEL